MSRNYATDDRVTPIVRSHNFGVYDPTPTNWQVATGHPGNGKSRALSDVEALAARVEIDGFCHDWEMRELRRREADALERSVIELVGEQNYYAHYPRSARAGLAGFPDPAKVPAIARLQGRTLRVSKQTSPEDAAAARKRQLLRRRRDTATGLLASGKPPAHYRPVDPRVAALNDAYAEGRIRYTEYRDRVKALTARPSTTKRTAGRR